MRVIRLILGCILAAVCFGIPTYGASVEDVVSLVSKTQYQHYLDEVLFTHEGDDRAYGPEHDMAMTNIMEALTGFGLQTTLEPFQYNGGTYYNIVGILPGKGARSNEIYLIGSHYDSAESDEGAGVPGADDNGSGVAGMLEAARVLSQFDFDATLAFVSFDREEDDVVGSGEYVIRHAQDRIKGMIALDMIANNNAGRKPEICCLDLSKPLMLSLSNAVALYGGGLAVSYGGPETNADHFSFESVGISACLLFEGGTNPFYHTPEDSVDTPNYIDYDFATGMTRAAVGWMATAAGLNTGPKLQITLLPGQKVKLTWPTSSARAMLQSAPDLEKDSWAEIPASEIVTEGTNSISTQSTATGVQFYRLVN